MEKFTRDLNPTGNVCFYHAPEADSTKEIYLNMYTVQSTLMKICYKMFKFCLFYQGRIPKQDVMPSCMVFTHMPVGHDSNEQVKVMFSSSFALYGVI